MIVAILAVSTQELPRLAHAIGTSNLPWMNISGSPQEENPVIKTPIALIYLETSAESALTLATQTSSRRLAALSWAIGQQTKSVESFQLMGLPSTVTNSLVHRMLV
jgi:hypothetical protein